MVPRISLSKNTLFTYFLLLLLTITCWVCYIVITKNSPKSLKSSFLNKPHSASPIPTRSPYPLVPDQGSAGTFKISQSQKSGPIFTSAIIDPLDAKLQEKVTIVFTLKSTQPLESITGKIKTDHNPITIILSPQSRKDDIEMWSTSFTLSEPNLYDYIIELKAKDQYNQVTSYSLPLRSDL